VVLDEHLHHQISHRVDIGIVVVGTDLSITHRNVIASQLFASNAPGHFEVALVDGLTNDQACMPRIKKTQLFAVPIMFVPGQYRLRCDVSRVDHQPSIANLLFAQMRQQRHHLVVVRIVALQVIDHHESVRPLAWCKRCDCVLVLVVLADELLAQTVQVD
jgi:hypothetical protein